MPIVFCYLSTKMAMGGSMTFRESLSKRLGIIRPTQQQVWRLSAMCM